jgi:hypothetical protein
MQCRNYADHLGADEEPKETNSQPPDRSGARHAPSSIRQIKDAYCCEKAAVRGFFGCPTFRALSAQAARSGAIGAVPVAYEVTQPRSSSCRCSSATAVGGRARRRYMACCAFDGARDATSRATLPRCAGARALKRWGKQAWAMSARRQKRNVGHAPVGGGGTKHRQLAVENSIGVAGSPWAATCAMATRADQRAREDEARLRCFLVSQGSFPHGLRGPPR